MPCETAGSDRTFARCFDKTELPAFRLYAVIGWLSLHHHLSTQLPAEGICDEDLGCSAEIFNGQRSLLKAAPARKSCSAIYAGQAARTERGRPADSVNHEKNIENSSLHQFALLVEQQDVICVRDEGFGRIVALAVSRFVAREDRAGIDWCLGER